MHYDAFAMQKIPFTSDEIKAIIRDLQLRVTPSRIALIHLLQRSEKPQSIDEIAKQLGDVGMDRATIYRNLVILQGKNLVRQVDLHRDHGYYEWNDHSDHHHLICKKCRKIQDFHGCDFEQIEKTALKQAPEFSKVTEHSFELFGLCKQCDVSA